HASAAEAFPDVLGQQIRFQVNRRDGLLEAQGGDGKRVRDESNAETVAGDVDEGEADTVDGDGAFRHHLLGESGRAGEPDELPLALAAPLGDAADAIDVPLHEMSAEPVAEAKGAFEVDAIKGFQLAEVGLRKCLRPGL